MKNYDLFKEYAVQDVHTVEEFLSRYYKPERYTGRGDEYAGVLLESYKEDIRRKGFTNISHFDSVTGKDVAFYPQPRKISNKELADLSDEWENSKVDTSKYYDSRLEAYEVIEPLYTFLKNAGVLCQICNGRYYTEKYHF